MKVLAAFGLTCCLFAQGADTRAAESRPEPMRLGLADAVNLALRNNLDLRAAAMDQRIAATRVREALGELDPVLYGDLGGGHREQRFPGVFPNPSNPSQTLVLLINDQSETSDGSLGIRGLLATGATYDFSLNTDYQYQQENAFLNPIFNSTANLRLTQPLLRGAWESYVKAPIEQAKISVQESVESWRGAVLTGIRGVETAYLDLLFAIEDLKTRRRSLEVADEVLATTRIQVETGAFPRVELTSAESARAFRFAEVLSAEAKVTESEDRLRKEIFSFDAVSDWTTPLVPTDPIEPPEAVLLPVASLIDVALKREPNVLAARLVIERQKIDVERRLSERAPKLDAFGNISANAVNDDGIQAWEDAFNRATNALSWRAGVQFEMALGNRSAKARLAEAELVVQKSRMQLHARETDVTYEVRNAVRNLETARRNIKARREALRLAEEQLANERTKLESQASTNLAVFQVEDQLNLRRTELVRAYLDARLALLDLPRVTGAPIEELTAKP